MGEVSISWVGVPSSDFLTDKAIDILNAYLSDSAISPLQRQLVEIDDPWASDLGFDTSDQSTTVINLGLQAVPTEKLETVFDAVKKTLQDVVDKGVDMDRISMVLHREQRRVRQPCAAVLASASKLSLTTIPNTSRAYPPISF